ncbi:MAG: hypothetical protein J3K34DRAFT_518107 [Monoraphidium minutum]|nr:MAG: hypothetical protein J3K34DRAFT_518107 [Monoraphidium minutum]
MRQRVGNAEGAEHAPPLPPTPPPPEPAPAPAPQPRRRRTARPADPAAGAGGAAGGAALARVAERQQAVRRWAAAYFNGQPEVSDDVYDQICAELAGLEDALRREAPGDAEAAALLAASPLRAVGAPVAPPPGGRKVRHETAMLSLPAAQDKGGVLDWGRRLARLGVDAARAAFAVEPKVDGLAVRAVYRDGKLALAATRGDGFEGEDVTHNALTGAIAGLPLELNLAAATAAAARDGSGRGGARGGVAQLPRELEVRGEVFMTKDDFAALNAARGAAGERPFDCARSAAAGSLRLLDPAAAAARRLSFLGYQLMVPGAAGGGGKEPILDATAAITTGSAALPATQSGCLSWLAAAGVAAAAGPGGGGGGGGLEAAVAAAEEWMGKRDALPYDCDGCVLKLDDLALWAALGAVDRDPRWAVAWKFPAREFVTRLLGVEWAVGRTGHVTPVALLQEVKIGGASVRRASLHSAGHLEALQLRPGCDVRVRRSGDIIPQVLGAVPGTAPRGAPLLAPPQQCPACMGPLARREGSGAYALACGNPACGAQAERALLHWADKCVKGLGAARVSALFRAGTIATIADLYKLSEAQWLQLDKVGPKMAASYSAALRASLGQPMGVALAGFGIPLVGPRLAEDLAARFGSIRALADNAESVSGAAGDNLRAWLASADSKQLLSELEAAGLRCMRAPAAAPPGAAAGTGVAAAGEEEEGGGGAGASSRDPAGALDGYNVVVTGSFSLQGSRKDLEARLKMMGARVQAAVSGTTTLLVCGDGGGRKRADAERAGVRAMGEAEFHAWLETLAGAHYAVGKAERAVEAVRPGLEALAGRGGGAAAPAPAAGGAAKRGRARKPRAAAGAGAEAEAGAAPVEAAAGAGRKRRTKGKAAAAAEGAEGAPAAGGAAKGGRARKPKAAAGAGAEAEAGGEPAAGAATKRHAKGKAAAAGPEEPKQPAARRGTGARGKRAAASAAAAGEAAAANAAAAAARPRKSARARASD